MLRFTCEARAVEQQKLNQTTPFALRLLLVKFLIFNLLSLIWLELGLLDLLDLLVDRLVLLCLPACLANLILGLLVG